MKYFEGIKIGSRVDSLEFGIGKLHSIVSYVIDSEFNLQVAFPIAGDPEYPYKYFMYSYDGKREKQELQTLFYPGVKVIEPERN